MTEVATDTNVGEAVVFWICSILAVSGALGMVLSRKAVHSALWIALTMTNVYELADNNRADLIFTKDQLLAPLQQGMLQPPFPMADGLEERDYYLGKVSTATDTQRQYVEAHTHRSDDAEVTS